MRADRHYYTSWTWVPYFLAIKGGEPPYPNPKYGPLKTQMPVQNHVFSGPILSRLRTGRFRLVFSKDAHFVKK